MTTLTDWCAVFHPIRSESKANREGFTRFPALYDSCMLCSLLLARVITYVLVLRQSIESHSIIGEGQGVRSLKQHGIHLKDLAIHQLEVNKVKFAIEATF